MLLPRESTHPGEASKVGWTPITIPVYSIAVSINPPLIKTRSVRPGPECRFLRAALRRGLPVSSSDALLLLEPALPTGVPDLIAVELRPRRISTRAKWRRFRPLHLQILHFLSESGSRTIDEIERLLNHRSRTVAVILQDLENEGFVLRKRERFVTCSISNLFVVKHIVAIEAKMRAWREALEQAVTNLWFASHSYILIPALRCVDAVREEAEKFGVGVLVFDGEQTKTVLRPRKQRIPTSYGSWLINEWALQQLGQNPK